MQLTTKSGQAINLVITKTPRTIPTGKPFVHPDGNDKGFFIKNRGTEKVTLKVILVDDNYAEETDFDPGWNIEMVKAIVSDVPSGVTLQYSE